MYALLKYAHAWIGALALITFWLAGFARKGSNAHRWIGRIYLIAMCGILATGFPMAALAYSVGFVEQAIFLAYLLVITGNAMWLAWSAVRNKQSFAGFTGPMYRALMVLTPIAGVITLIVGIQTGATLLMGFSVIGIISGYRMFQGIRRGPEHRLWWREAHMDAMLGNAIATHIAFLSIGLPKLLPMLSGPVLQNLAWFGPVVIAWTARAFLIRRFPKGAPIPTNANQPTRATVITTQAR